MSKAGNKRRKAGLYHRKLVATWEDLLLDGRVIVEGTVIVGSKSTLDGELVIPEGITEIGVKAFRGRTGLTKVEFPNSLVNIEDFAFYGCSEIIDLVFREGLCEIGYASFSRCTAIESVDFPQSLSILGKDAFYGCINLRKVNMPDTLSNVYDTSLYGCNIDSIIWRGVDYNFIDIFLTVFTNEDVTRPSKTSFFRS